MVDLVSSARCVSDLPSDHGKIVDVIAGALLRIFTKLAEVTDQQEAILRRLDSLDRRVDTLETVRDNAEFEARKQAIVTPLPRLGGRPARRSTKFADNVDDHAASL
jgi:hypothetical protein